MTKRYPLRLSGSLQALHWEKCYGLYFSSFFFNLRNLSANNFIGLLLARFAFHSDKCAIDAGITGESGESQVTNVEEVRIGNKRMCKWLRGLFRLEIHLEDCICHPQELFNCEVYFILWSSEVHRKREKEWELLICLSQKFQDSNSIRRIFPSWLENHLLCTKNFFVDQNFHNDEIIIWISYSDLNSVSLFTKSSETERFCSYQRADLPSAGVNKIIALISILAVSYRLQGLLSKFYLTKKIFLCLLGKGFAGPSWWSHHIQYHIQ